MCLGCSVNCIPLAIEGWFCQTHIQHMAQRHLGTLTKRGQTIRSWRERFGRHAQLVIAQALHPRRGRCAAVLRDLRRGAHREGQLQYEGVLRNSECRKGLLAFAVSHGSGWHQVATGKRPRVLLCACFPSSLLLRGGEEQFLCASVAACSMGICPESQRFYGSAGHARVQGA